MRLALRLQSCLGPRVECGQANTGSFASWRFVGLSETLGAKRPTLRGPKKQFLGCELDRDLGSKFVRLLQQVQLLSWLLPQNQA